jgi:archaeosine-15-forming tRNA-guanine transglycosylase
MSDALEADDLPSDEQDTAERTQSNPLATVVDEDTITFPAGVDVSKPSVARVYDALLGGKDNFPADRVVRDKLLELTPGGAGVPLYNRAVLGRAVRYMVEQGIRQFVDLGSGLPTAQNTHQVAQAVAPETRVVYVDNDPIVLIHGRALLAGSELTTVITADLRDPAAVLADPDLTGLIDLTQPVGLLMVGVIHHLNDDEDPNGLVSQYKDAIAPGSFVFVTHFIDGGAETAAIERVMLTDLGSGRFRSFEEVEEFLSGLDLVEPGMVYGPHWRPDPTDVLPVPLDVDAKMIGAGMGRKP